MFRRIALWLFGYVTCECESRYFTRFLNLCRHHQISIRYITQEKQKVSFICPLADYLRMKALAKKSGCYPKIRQKCGFYFAVKKMKPKKGIMIGILLAALFTGYCANRILYISMDGNYFYSQESIADFLQNNHITIGTKKSSVDCAALEMLLRKEFQNISWVSAEKKGTALYLRFSENVLPVTIERPEQACHLIATTDGIIRTIGVESGIAIKKKGDSVKAGEIIISGIIPIIGDNNVKIRDEYTTASGIVLIEAEIPYHREQPLTYQKKVFQGEKYGGIIYFGNVKIFSYTPRYSETKYDIISEDVYFRMSRYFTLPIRMLLQVTRRYESTTEKYTALELEQLSKEHFIRHLKYLESEQIKVLSYQISGETIDNMYQTSGSCLTVGNYVRYREITETEQGEQDEYITETISLTDG